MSRDPYRGGREDYGYPGGRGGGGSSGVGGSNRWDTERFAAERRGGGRFDSDRDFFEERDTRVTSRGNGPGRPRERSVDEIYERRGPRFDDDRYERRHFHDDDEPRFERERPFGRDRGETTNITIEKERYSPSPPRRGNRPSFLRRQSSLDTFDRKPLTRYQTRDEYGPPARHREEFRPPPLVPIPLPKTRQLGPPPRHHHHDRDFDDIRVAEPDYYGDEEFRGYPERVREREVVRRRRRSRSRESRSHRGSVRSDSTSSSSSSDRETTITVKNEFPKKGKTRMPARLVSKKAIIDLGYPFEEEGDTIIIMKALGRENIDEVIKLSEDYKGDNDHIVETEHTTYLVGPGAELSSGRSDVGNTVFEERKTEQVFNLPPPLPPPPQGWMPPPPPVPVQEIITDTKITETHNHGHQHSNAPIIVDAHKPHHHHDTTYVENTYVERSEAIPVGPLALALPERNRPKDERAIRAEIRALEAEKEALRAEKRAEKEMRKADRLRHGGRTSDSDLVLYDRERIDTRNEDVTIIRRERIEEPEGGVRIEKDRKAPPPPRVIRAMLKTLT